MCLAIRLRVWQKAYTRINVRYAMHLAMKLMVWQEAYTRIQVKCIYEWTTVRVTGVAAVWLMATCKKPLACFSLELLFSDFGWKNWHQLSIIILSAKQYGFYFMIGMSGKYPPHSCCSKKVYQLDLLCVSNAFVLVSESLETNYSFNTKLPESWTPDVSKPFIIFKDI